MHKYARVVSSEVKRYLAVFNRGNECVLELLNTLWLAHEELRDAFGNLRAIGFVSPGSKSCYIAALHASRCLLRDVPVFSTQFDHQVLHGLLARDEILSRSLKLSDVTIRSLRDLVTLGPKFQYCWSDATLLNKAASVVFSAPVLQRAALRLDSSVDSRLAFPLSDALGRTKLLRRMLAEQHVLSRCGRVVAFKNSLHAVDDGRVLLGPFTERLDHFSGPPTFGTGLIAFATRGSPFPIVHSIDSLLSGEIEPLVTFDELKYPTAVFTRDNRLVVRAVGGRHYTSTYYSIDFAAEPTVTRLSLTAQVAEDQKYSGNPLRLQDFIIGVAHSSRGPVDIVRGADTVGINCASGSLVDSKGMLHDVEASSVTLRSILHLSAYLVPSVRRDYFMALLPVCTVLDDTVELSGVRFTYKTDLS